jgi:hypothetical protein
MVCPWFTVVKVGDDDRVLHISVDQNETGSERRAGVSVDNGICGGDFFMTQSAPVTSVLEHNRQIYRSTD